jgi:oxygen-independent coproporphyrinogen-3 oxidase
VTIKHLYLHIPFCHRRCSYCDFNTYANMEDRIEAYVDALCREIAARAEGWGRAAPGRPDELRTLAQPLARADLLPTVFFGGGTPSLLSLGQLERILRAADALVPLGGAEVTLEANPGTVLGRDYLRGLRDLGVNRISMGVQSLHDPTLRVLGRIHTAAEAQASFADARAAGFRRINLDFIFGLPGQTLEQWDATLREIAAWGADHFSLYSLILEPSTPLHAQVTAGRVSVPDDDAAGEMYELAMERLPEAGLVQYEISNWATGAGEPGGTPRVPRQACHHNLAYWLNADYLACGAGAHGHAAAQRYADVLGIDAYIAEVRAGRLPTAETTLLSQRDICAETMMMGLRLNVGVGFAHFRERCGVGLEQVYAAELAELAELGLLERDALAVRLTPRGRLLGNQVFERFL